MRRESIRLAAAVCCLGLSAPCLFAQSETKAIDEIQRLGGKVKTVKDAGAGVLYEVSFHSCEISNEHLALVTQLPRVTTLDLSRTEISNEGMVHLAKLTHLRKLNLGYTQVTDSGLVYLKDMKDLRWLNLERPCKNNKHWLTNACVPHLQKLTRLEYLDLDWGNLDDACLDSLRAMTHLRELRLGVQAISKEGVHRLQKAMPGTNVGG